MITFLLNTQRYNMKILISILAVLTALFILGCSNASTGPTSPSNTDLPASTPSTSNESTQVLLTGIMNLDNGTVEFNGRSADPYLDVTTYVGTNFWYTLDAIIPPDEWHIGLHIFNASPFIVYDVAIVFEELYGKTVDNPDSYTDIFDPGDLDPYIAWMDDDPQRKFPPGQQDDTRLRLIVPVGAPLTVDFFIIAHLPGNTGGIVELADFVQIDPITQNGSGDISIDVYDHQGDITEVKADTTAFNGGITTLLPMAPPTWQGTVDNTLGATPGSYDILIWATSPSTPQYTIYDWEEIDVT